MKNTAKFSCKIGTTDASAPLGMEIWIDDQKIFDTEHVDSTVECNGTISDNEGDHKLRFIMKNKTSGHTQVDKSGQIVKDACLTISDVTFEDIELGYTLIEKATYTHNFNGTQPEVVDEFYGSMGCNGTVSLEFTTPIYLWLLENM
jgi:hypothetical protein